MRAAWAGSPAIGRRQAGSTWSGWRITSSLRTSFKCTIFTRSRSAHSAERAAGTELIGRRNPGGRHVSNLAAARAFIALALLKVACGLAAFVLPEHQAYLFPAWIGAAQMLAYAAASALLVAGTRRDARATNLAAYFLGFASM